MQQTKQATTRVKDVNTFIVADAPVCGLHRWMKRRKKGKQETKER
jgi:hypothetical protein